MNGRPVTIRTIDVGADKPLDSMSGDGYETAPNPALGLRAIRWSLSEPQMFMTQLRAILRASAFGQVVSAGTVLGEGVTVGADNILSAGMRVFPNTEIPDGAIKF